MDNWKEYSDKISERYPDIDKKTIRRIVFYGFRSMYNIMKRNRDTSIIMMPGNHYVSFGNLSNPGIEFEKKFRETKEIGASNKFFTIENGIVVPKWFKFPDFKNEYYLSISFKEFTKLKKNGNYLKDVVMSSSLDYIKIFGGIIIKVPSPVFRGDVLRGNISFVTYDIINPESRPTMLDLYYKHNKPKDINYFEKWEEKERLIHSTRG